MKTHAYLGSKLTDNDASGWNGLPAINLDATTFAHRVTPVLSRTAPFFMGSLNCEGYYWLGGLHVRDATVHWTSSHKRRGAPDAGSKETGCQHLIYK